jgi:hypothetical protein
MAKRIRRMKSVADELVKKSREAMIAAVQIFNSPTIHFKSELFITTSIIAWTYLLHAHYRKIGVEYRVKNDRPPRGKWKKSRHGAVWHLGLEDCLNLPECPIKGTTAKNLLFLIRIRHEIEHQMTSQIDDHFSAKFQACALNYNREIKKLFGEKFSLDSEQAISIQFSSFTEGTSKELMSRNDLPKHIHMFISTFEQEMTAEEFDDPHYGYRVAFVRKAVAAKSTADQVIQFVNANSELGEAVNNVFLKETEKQKYRPATIVKMMKNEGYTWFTMTAHINMWKEQDAKNPKHRYGTQVETSWFWYESWLTKVRELCAKRPTSKSIQPIMSFKIEQTG